MPFGPCQHSFCRGDDLPSAPESDDDDDDDDETKDPRLSQHRNEYDDTNVDVSADSPVD